MNHETFEIKQLKDVELTDTIREILTLAANAKAESRKLREETPEDNRNVMAERLSGEYRGYVRVLALMTGIRSYLNVQGLIKEWETL